MPALNAHANVTRGRSEHPFFRLAHAHADVMAHVHATRFHLPIHKRASTAWDIDFDQILKEQGF